MKIDRLAKTLLILSVFFWQFSTYGSPVGEVVRYQMVKDSKRTSNIMREGRLDLQIDDLLEDANGESYRTKMTFIIDMIFSGRQRGLETIRVVPEYFEDHFWETLRSEGETTTPYFKIRHLGRSSTTTSSGEHFENCDRVLFYDIKVEKKSYLTRLWRRLANVLGGAKQNNDFEDMKFSSYICSGVDALRAAKVDITGRSRGFNFKIGYDLIR